MTRFTGKRVLVTGGASGIGEATADRFLREGAHVVVLDRSREHLDAAEARLKPWRADGAELVFDRVLAPCRVANAPRLRRGSCAASGGSFGCKRCPMPG